MKEQSAQQTESKPLLPANRAFVVQLRREAEVKPRRLGGRVEHVVSGRAAQFDSVEELLTFIEGMLDETK